MEDKYIWVIIGCVAGIVFIGIIVVCVCLAKRSQTKRHSGDFRQTYNPPRSKSVKKRPVHALDIRRSDSERVPGSRPVSDESQTFHFTGTANGQVQLRNSDNKPDDDHPEVVLRPRVVSGYGPVALKSTYQPAHTSVDSSYQITSAIIRESTEALIPKQEQVVSNVSQGVQNETVAKDANDVTQQALIRQSSKYDSSKLGLVRRDKENKAKLPDWIEGKPERKSSSPKNPDRSHVTSVHRAPSSGKPASHPPHPQRHRAPDHAGSRVSYMSGELGVSGKGPLLYGHMPIQSKPLLHPYGAPVDPRLSGISLDLGADFQTAYGLTGGNVYYANNTHM